MAGENKLLVRYHVEPAEQLLLATPTKPHRADELWKTTCFELFLKLPDDTRYWEYNFSPSSQWAAYSFDRYRLGMKAAALLTREPHIETRTQGAQFHLDAEINLADIPAGPLLVNLTAVIEEIDGTQSYWAVAHAPDKPDFHDPSCFTIVLVPPNAP